MTGPAPKRIPKTVAPKATAPKATAPKATAPKATAPKATAPKATAPKATAPVKVKSPGQKYSEEMMERDRKKKATEQTQQQKTGFHAIMPRAIYFNDPDPRTGRFGESASPLTMYRKASRVTPWVKRGAEAAGDIGDIAAGKPPKDPFYKKSWFRNAALTAALATPYAVARGHRRGVRISEGGVYDHNRTWLDDKVYGPLGRSAKAKWVSDHIPFGAIVPRAIHFATIDPLERGWDLRDARGKSARVYAPGSRRRERREKDWGEKTENIRLVRNAALVGAAGLGGLAIYQGVKMKKAKAQGATEARQGLLNAYRKARKEGRVYLHPRTESNIKAKAAAKV